MVDVSRVLLDHTAALDAARACTSSVLMWCERRGLCIQFFTRGVDNEGWGRMGSRRISRWIIYCSVIVIIIIFSR